MERDKKINTPELIYADDDIIVVDKPAGMPVHEAKHSTDRTLTDWLLERFPEIESVGDVPAAEAKAIHLYRPGIVHRLDKLTSGVMVVARNQESFLRLKELFQSRAVVKVYLALACGHLKEQRGTITGALGRLASSPTKMGAVGARGGIRMPKEAVTEYAILERFDCIYTERSRSAHRKQFSAATLLEVRPRTGRMHQIRVHLASIGHPVAGDVVYGGRGVCFRELGRQFLHAATLSFAFREGQMLSFSAELPKELAELLQKIRAGTQ